MPSLRSALFAVLVPLVTCGCDGRGSSTEPSPTGSGSSTLGQCNVSPNYVNSTLADTPPARLLRWQSDRFPLAVYLDVSSVPSNMQPLYRDSVTVGADLWNVATQGRIGRFALVASSSGANITMRFSMRSDTNYFALTTSNFAGSVVQSASISFERSSFELELAQRDPRFVVLSVSSTVAHEMGHALGVMLHSPDPADLMAPGPLRNPIQIGQDPRTFITPSDLNTMSHAYCR